MSASRSHRLFQKALERWPKDPLRPDCQLQDVLAKRLKAGKSLLPPYEASLTGAAREQAELKQANALYGLLENRYKTKYTLASGRIMKPKSNPTYYEDLVKELEEAPNRTWFGRIANRLKGLVRLE
ncbi:hypothetical protein V8F20_004241 [Naviculisporaceae sp. PSN 640]